MFIVDSQVHIWAANTPERPWAPGHHEPHMPQPFSKDDLLREMDTAGVHRAVLLPPSWIGNSNEVALEAAQRHPDRLAVMGRLDFEAPGARKQLADWRRQPGMLGLRFTINIREDGTDDWIWSESEAGLVPIVLVSNGQLELVGKVAQRYPKLKLMIDKLGIPRRAFEDGLREEKAFADLDKLLKLAKHPNIAVKASALPGYATDEYPYRSLHPYIRRVYDTFGPKRIFWGTDLTKLPCTYRQSITMFTEEMPWLNAADLEWIMGRGICEWTGWKLP